MKSKKAFALMILAGILWGSSGIFVNLLSPYGFTPIQLVATRATVSFVLLGMFVLLKDRKAFLTESRRVPLFIALAVTLFLSMFLYYSSMVRTSVCTAVILLDLHPVYVTAVSAVIFKERLSPIKVTSIFAMLVGCAFVSGVFGGIKLDFAGLILGILSGVAYASYVLLVKYYNREGVASTTANIYTFLFMTVISLSVCKPLSLFLTASSDPIPTVPLLIALGICTSVIPFVLNGIALHDLSAGTVAALGIMEPLSATVFSVAFFNEPMDAWKIVGVVIILSAVVFLGLDEIWAERKADKASGKQEEKEFAAVN